MSVKVYIQDKATKEPIEGAIYFYSGDVEVGTAAIPKDGLTIDLPGPKMLVTAPSYYDYGYLNSDQLYDETVFYLERKVPNWGPVAIGGLIALFLFKFFKP